MHSIELQTLKPIDLSILHAIQGAVKDGIDLSEMEIRCIRFDALTLATYNRVASIFNEFDYRASSYIRPNERSILRSDEARLDRFRMNNATTQNVLAFWDWKIPEIELAYIPSGSNYNKDRENTLERDDPRDGWSRIEFVVRDTLKRFERIHPKVVFVPTSSKQEGKEEILGLLRTYPAAYGGPSTSVFFMSELQEDQWNLSFERQLAA